MSEWTHWHPNAWYDSLNPVGFPTPPGDDDNWDFFFRAWYDQYSTFDHPFIDAGLRDFEPPPNFERFLRDYELAPDRYANNKRWLDAFLEWQSQGRPNRYRVFSPGSVQAELLNLSGYYPPTALGRQLADERYRRYLRYHANQRKFFIARALSQGASLLLPFVDAGLSWFNPLSWTSNKITQGLQSLGFGRTYNTALAAQTLQAAQAFLEQPVYKQLASHFLQSGLESWLYSQANQSVSRGIHKAITGSSGKQALSPDVYDIPTYLQSAVETKSYIRMGRELMQGVYDHEINLLGKSFSADPTDAIRLFREYYGLHPSHPLPNWNEIVSMVFAKDFSTPFMLRGVKYALQHYEKWVPQVIKYAPDFVKDAGRAILAPKTSKYWNAFTAVEEKFTALYWARKFGYEGDVHWLFDLPFWLIPIPGTRVAKGVKVGKKLVTSKKAQQIAQRTIQRRKVKGMPIPKRVKTRPRIWYLPAQKLPDLDVDLSWQDPLKVFEPDLKWRYNEHSRSESGRTRWRGRVPYRFRRRRGTRKSIYKRKRY